MVKLHYGPLAAALLAAPSAHAFAPPSSTVVVNQQQQYSPLSLYKKQECSTIPTTTTTSLRSSSSNINPYTSPELDTSALLKYATAAITELTLFAATFQLLDVAFTNVLDTSVPFPFAFLLFYGCSLKSRVFNPLNNQRPDRSKAVDGEGSSGFKDRVMPSWTPPGVTFPIMWLLIIGPIRAYSASLIVSSTGSFLCLPIMAFMLHLTIGDIWNTINNTEKRYGAAVIGVLCVVLSAANAANQYFAVDPFAGKLLGGTLIWLCTAAALITDTWRLNPSEEGLVPLYPVVGEAETSFMWFGNNDAEDE
ncbi:translocator protein [Skeletonema marinoi]|uniref:Translocator protein n=1 Tax=Skeletonema marinoi TaxID=267567 RepID=A0AAD9DET8_9STRA|nr:translocator protein [Skeletonema marinoi]